VPPGLSAGLAVAPDATLDAISGHFRLFQLRAGHRFSTDDILAACNDTLVAGPRAQLGTVASRQHSARLVTIEVQP
jgi:tRNA1Val (adenine37-N6)-methyltransferase